MNSTTHTVRKVVIAGGGALGAGVAAKLRRLDERLEIVLIERGPHVSFAACGLPYYLGNVITDRRKLLLHSPESLWSRFRIDVRVNHEIISIDRARKTVIVRPLLDGESYEETYDKLVLGMGAEPIIPSIPGIDLKGIFRLRTVPDVDAIKTWIQNNNISRAVVIGGGFIGLETVENLRTLGLEITLVEKAAQLLPPFDVEMTAPALNELAEMGVNVILRDGIAGFEGVDRATGVRLESGTVVKGDLFLLALGVRPNSTLARQAGLDLGPTGAVRVNKCMQTSDPDIYSGGDMAEIVHQADGMSRWIPLAGAPNKQSRVIAQHIIGKPAEFRGALGTAIVRMGNTVLAKTGLTEKEAKSAGFDFFTSYVTAPHHANFYPGGEDMTIKLVVDRISGRVLGAQIVGHQGVDKRIDVLATAISAQMTVSDLRNLDLAYAPPFSSAKDPIVMAGMVADNIWSGEVESVTRLEELQGGNVAILDVRTKEEVARGMLPGAVHIPLDELRDRLDELNPDLHWVVYCRSGQRSYFATRILKGHGFRHVYNLNGGYIVQQMRREAGPR